MTEPKIEAVRGKDGFVGYIVEGDMRTTIRKDSNGSFKTIESLVATAALMRPGHHFWIGDVKVEDVRPNEMQRRIHNIRWSIIFALYGYALLGSIFKWWPFQ